MSLSKKIIISLITGVATGLFFGEYCSFFSYIGDGFLSA
jgi:Na+/H+-dicarboxylate symporter